MAILNKIRESGWFISSYARKVFFKCRIKKIICFYRAACIVESWRNFENLILNSINLNKCNFNLIAKTFFDIFNSTHSYWARFCPAVAELCLKKNLIYWMKVFFKSGIPRKFKILWILKLIKFIESWQPHRKWDLKVGKWVDHTVVWPGVGLR